MGHLHDGKAIFQELRERVDKTQSGMPETPEAFEILSHLFTEEEARIGSVMPLVPRRIGTIARRVGMPKAELEKKLDRMADKGLVFDFTHPARGKYYMLAPPVVGFFEMSMMRVRQDIDQKEVARLLSLYLYERKDFLQEALRGGTPIGRALLHETSMGDGVSSDVLSYERASEIIADAPKLAVSLCYCRHKRSHLGEACDAPQEVCMVLGRAAEFAVQHGHGRPAEKAELLEKLAISREHGLVHIADNVRNEPTYICNCCGCCCGQLSAINRHGITHAVATSNYLAQIDASACSGCGKCVRRCPVRAVSLRARPPHLRATTKKKMVAEVDVDACLGCGVCHPTCSTGALVMKRREKRVLTPESTLERVLSMALGRGHVHDLLFDEHDGPTAAFLNRLTGAIENMAVSKTLVLNESLKSRFVQFLAAQAKKGARGEAVRATME
jgi:formate hydrogenlyase subunit 6/NADH:ubiquinone oxidoreductase subunit I